MTTTTSSSRSSTTGWGSRATRRAGWGCTRCASGPSNWAERSPSNGASMAAPRCAPDCRSGNGKRSPPMADEIRILLVDDHPVYRDGLGVLLGSIDGFQVVAAASDGVEAVAAAASSHPDVIVMDIQMPVMDGIEATRRIVAADPGAGIVVLTMSDDDESVFQAMRSGARGYLLKAASQEDIAQAI